MVEIDVILLEEQPLKESIKKCREIPIPEPIEKFNLQGAIRNCTQFEIKLGKDVYWYSGRYEEWPPTKIDPFGIATFTAVHRDGVPSGATGGNTWTLHIQKGDKYEFDFALGFTEPVLGSSKAAIVESTSAQAGYDAASENGNATTSKGWWTGEDGDGNARTIRFDCTAQASRPCRLYEVVQSFY